MISLAIRCYIIDDRNFGFASEVREKLTADQSPPQSNTP